MRVVFNGCFPVLMSPSVSSHYIFIESSPAPDPSRSVPHNNERKISTLDTSPTSVSCGHKELGAKK